MVHLAAIPQKDSEKDSDAESTITNGLKKVHLQLANDEDCYTTSVYGSRFAAEDLPRHEMPEKEMPKEVAYRMIKDELSLDGNPMLK
jgi:glutamate decarboxylase